MVEKISFKSRITSLILATAVLISMLGIEMLAATPIYAAAAPVNVKVRVNTENNKPAKSFNLTVDGTESDLIDFKDNADVVSAVDVLVSVHKKEFGASFDGNETDYVYVDSEFGAVNPFWRKANEEALKTYQKNKEVMLMETSAADGDEFAFANVFDSDGYSDKYIYFDGDIVAETNGDISAKVKSYSTEYETETEYDDEYNLIEKDEAVKGAVVEFKSDQETLTATTDANGIAKVKATNPGTYKVNVIETPFEYAAFPPEETVKAEPVQPTGVDFTRKEGGSYTIDKAAWKTYGINYTDIDFNRDIIVDIRNTSDSSKNNYVDIINGAHFVYCKKADVTEAQVLTDSAKANLDAVDAGGKRMVFICYSGNAFARVAMQWANEKGLKLGSGQDSQATYLIGGAGGVISGNDDAHNEAYKYNLGIGYTDITSNDVILDVRSKENFDKGHLPGAVHVDVTDEGGKLSDKDKADMAAALAKVPSGSRLVIVCNTGNALAYKAMSYFMADKTSAGLENLKKVSYLIGGDKAIPADKKVATEENKPAASITDGQIATIKGCRYQVISAGAKTAALIKAANKKSLTVPATITINGEKLHVVKIAPKAFKGTKVKTLTVKTKKLKKKSVKGSLKGSKVKTVKVKVGKKKVNKKYVKKYKKIFTKKNAGRKVRVK